MEGPRQGQGWGGGGRCRGATTPAARLGTDGWARIPEAPDALSLVGGGRPTWSHRPRPHPLSCRHLQTQPLPAASPRIGGTALIPSELWPVPHPQLGAAPSLGEQAPEDRHAGVTLVHSCPRGQRKAQPLPRPPGGVGKGPEAPPPPGRAGKPGEPLPGCAPAPPPPRNASILQTPTSRAVGPEPRTVRPLSGSKWTASTHLPQTAIVLPRKHRIRTHDLHGDVKAGGEPPSPCGWRLCSALESSLAI